MLRISLLGAFQVERDGELLSGDEWRGRQMRTILKILAHRVGEVIPADQFIELLWPDEDPTAASSASTWVRPVARSSPKLIGSNR
ncbi:MAG: hypothetical protein A2W35_03340 [Chloroflexi bacterium RBG_16_57_11]|nr:MAG: hypothetical protein A2W35_03340 [Chloroflexi bacterium RBG_16_57_11]